MSRLRETRSALMYCGFCATSTEKSPERSLRPTRPANLLEGPLASSVIEVPAQLVGRRGGKRHADDRIKLLEVAPFELEVHVFTLEIQRVEQRAVPRALWCFRPLPFSLIG